MAAGIVKFSLILSTGRWENKSIYMKTLLLFLSISLISFSQQYTIEQYLNIRGNGSPQYSHDDSRIYFTSSVTGSSQVWMMNEPGSWPQQVTFFNDRVSYYSFNPRFDVIAMEKDLGGSEYSNIYLLVPDGTSMQQLTENKPKVQYNFSRWFDDGSWFTFFSNERNPYYYDIYKYNMKSGTSTRLFQSDHSNYPSVISPDGNLIVITRSYASYDNDLILYNTITREQKIISKHDSETEPAEFYAISFSADGKKIYLNTNFRDEFYSLHEYDIAAGKLQRSDLKYYSSSSVPMELQWTVFNDDRTKAFFIMSENEYDKAFMYDLSKDRIIDVDPVFNSKNINSVEFAHNSAKMLVAFNSGKSPSVIYEWNYENKTIEQVTYANFAGIDPNSFVEPEIFTFTTSDDLQIRSLVYYPENFVKDGSFPCIVSAHGGPEGQSRYGFSSSVQYYVNAGYVVVEPNIRGSSGYGKNFAALDNGKLRENSVRDAAELVEELVKSNIANPEKIAIMGGSYGGYMVLACLTLYPDLFSAGVDIVGISNFITFLNNTAEYRRKNRESEYGSLTRDSLFLVSISPVHKFDKIKAPLMIIHGKNDPRVPVGEATQMYEAIRDRGGEAELLIYNDEGHGLSKLKNRLDAYPKIVSFLDKYVKNK